MKHLVIVIPAYNEEKRIESTLLSYLEYFNSQLPDLKTNFVVVLNGCRDNTEAIVQKIAQDNPTIVSMNITNAGKGSAVTTGFKASLTLYPGADYIGFVDADMATLPVHFHALIKELHSCDGTIASRYMPGAHVYPKRPWIKRLGSILMYDSLAYLLFGLSFFDLQCGAKVFKRNVIERIHSYLHIRNWSFDVELLYLCRYFNFTIKEIPTTWCDQADSKLSILHDGLRMPFSLIQLRLHYFRLVFGNKRTNLAKER